MARTKHGSGNGTKSAGCPEGNPIVAKVAPGERVMQRLRGSLGSKKPAPTLALVTDQPLSICQKVLAGNRLPNGAMYEALAGTELIVETFLGLIPDAPLGPKGRAVRRALRQIELDFEDER